MKWYLGKEATALNITKGSFKSFKQQVATAFDSIPEVVIDSIISSMSKRTEAIITSERL